MSTRSHVLSLRTPEGITFSLPLASPVSRFLAWLIDCACILAASAVFSKVFSVVGVADRGLAEASMVIGYFAISVGYGIACEWRWRGQTVGKRVIRLRVMDSEALNLQFSQVVVRNLLRFVDALPAFYLVGGAVCLLSRHSQRLGDLAANTIVIRQPKLVEPEAERWRTAKLSAKYNSLLEHRHLAARLRQRVPPRLAAIGFEALTRRDRLDSRARADLFAELAAHFKAAVEFPAEIEEQLSDEQYVRNVVEVLYLK